MVLAATVDAKAQSSCHLHFLSAAEVSSDAPYGEHQVQEQKGISPIRKSKNIKVRNPGMSLETIGANIRR